MHKNLLITLLLLLTINILSIAQNDKATFKKLEKSLKLIEGQYVEKVNSEDLVTKAIQAMVKELDPHSKYVSAESLIKTRETLNGHFAGVGIHYQIINDTLVILSTVTNGPSDQAGIKAGDKIISISGDSATGDHISNSFFSTRLRGKKGSKIDLVVLPHNSKTPKHITIKRGNIAINTVTLSYMIDSKTGFVKIKNFSRTTNFEFQLAVMQLQSMGMKNIIVDLRGNGGGLMIASIRLADDFLKEDKLIVYTKGANSPRTEYTSKSAGLMEEGRVIVLIDNNSASASEIFAGAIQDWDRGLIMGRRSFGKGLVGRNYTLPDGSAIRLTTGRYYTPSGRCIQKDYVKGEKDKYQQDFAKRMESGELYSADSVHFVDSLKYYTNGKRLVYGNGAIMPDIFVPLDTTYNIDYIRQVNRKGLLNYFSGIYFNENLAILQNTYPTYTSFENEFQLTEEDYHRFTEIAFNKYQIDSPKEDTAKIKNYFYHYAKAYLARNLYKDGAFYKIANKEDKVVIQALETINKKKSFKDNGVHE